MSKDLRTSQILAEAVLKEDLQHTTGYSESKAMSQRGVTEALTTLENAVTNMDFSDYLKKENLLSDIPNKGIARNHLGLSKAATAHISQTTGDDRDTLMSQKAITDKLDAVNERVDNQLNKTQNLYDLPDVAQARKNLGLTRAAVAWIKDGLGNADEHVMSQKAVTTELRKLERRVDNKLDSLEPVDYLNKLSNLSDLDDVEKARNNLGLSELATAELTQSIGSSVEKVMSQHAVTSYINRKVAAVEDTVSVVVAGQMEGVVKVYVGENEPDPTESILWLHTGTV